MLAKSILNSIETIISQALIDKEKFICIYKMYLISTEGYKKADACHLIIQKTGKIWASMENLQDGMGVKNMFDLILKEMHGNCETKNPTKEQIKKYKMTERDNF